MSLVVSVSKPESIPFERSANSPVSRPMSLMLPLPAPAMSRLGDETVRSKVLRAGEDLRELVCPALEAVDVNSVLSAGPSLNLSGSAVGLAVGGRAAR